jgi:hypothetical protein
MTGAHAQPRRAPFWRRHKIGAAVAGLLILGVGVAVALVLLRAPVSGQAEVVSPASIEWDVNNPPFVVDPATTGIIACTAVIEGDELVVTITDATPGSSCDVAATFVGDLEVGGPWRVQGITYNAQVDTTFVGLDTCTTDITGGGDQVRIRFTVGDVAPGTYPADAEASLLVVPTAEHVAANCPQV